MVSQDGETWYVPRKFLRDALELEIDKVVENAKADPDEEVLAKYTEFLADNAIQIAALTTELAKYPVEEA